MFIDPRPFGVIEGFLNLVLASHDVTLSATEVIWRRSAMLARGAMTASEAIGMVMEKHTAFAASAERAAIAAAKGGDAVKVATAALQPYRKTTAANARRLRK